MLTEAQVAEIKVRAEIAAREPFPSDADFDRGALIADRDELVRWRAAIEAAAQAFFASDTWCVGLRDHVSAKACPCGYAQLRAAFAPAAPVEDARP